KATPMTMPRNFDRSPTSRFNAIRIMVGHGESRLSMYSAGRYRGASSGRLADAAGGPGRKIRAEQRMGQQALLQRIRERRQEVSGRGARDQHSQRPAIDPVGHALPPEIDRFSDGSEVESHHLAEHPQSRLHQ